MNNKKIIAVDFDGTLCKSKFPDIGAPILPTINELKQEQKNGAAVILWTCRGGADLSAAVEWCKAQGLTFDAVNENLAEHIEQFGGDTRKVFATEYWDDRAKILSENREQFARNAAATLAREFLTWINQNRESLDDTIRWGRESGATTKGVEAYIRAAQLDDVLTYFKKILKKYGVDASI